MTTTTQAASNKEANTMARPTAGNGNKKEWKFDIKHNQEVPVVQRTGRRLPFDFGAMKLNSMFNVPKEFWMEFSGLSKEQANDKARNKEAIRRSFYGWRDQEGAKGRDKFALAFSDQADKDGNYTGVNVYLVEASAKPAKKAA